MTSDFMLDLTTRHDEGGPSQKVGPFRSGFYGASELSRAKHIYPIISIMLTFYVAHT